MSKILVAYFSRAGENFYSGAIRNLLIGNTKKVANVIANFLKGDLFEIKTKIPYTDDYYKCTEYSKKEKEKSARPELENLIDIRGYDKIFLGYPNWWNTTPMPVFTFLESFDFQRKTIYPFCTHEGSGFGDSIKDIRISAKNAKIEDGFTLIGSHCKNDKTIEMKVEEWLAKIIETNNSKGQ